MIQDVRAVVDLSEVDHGMYEVNRVNVPTQHRGYGHGSRLLRQVCADADTTQSTLVLYIHPTGPLDYLSLAAWYLRRGFRFADADETEFSYHMIREPKEQ